MNKTKQLPVIALRGLTVFPKINVHFDARRPFSLKALDVAMEEEQLIYLVTQKETNQEDIVLGRDVYPIGTVARVKQIVKLPHNVSSVVVEGLARGRIVQEIGAEEFWEAQVELIESTTPEWSETEKTAFLRMAKESVTEYLGYANKMNQETVNTIMKIEEVGSLADSIATYILKSLDSQQQILEIIDEEERIKAIIAVLHSETAILKIQRGIFEEVRRQVDKNQKDYYLREQMKIIRKELGEDEDISDELTEYKQKIKRLKAPAYVKERLEKERQRLKKMNSGSAESSVIRNYMDCLLDLPWKKHSKEAVNLKPAEKILNDEHYGMSKVKERILEHLAVRRLAKDMNTPIICLVGPPGTGKTSIAKSIASALNREYVRMSLGGLRDEAEIRGHRRTYIGAMPGRMVQALRQAGTSNPLILLDELDKMNSDFRGDPASAMLEVLDGEQNKHFRDHYIEIPVDLSSVLFLATANSLRTIPRPLMDRLEIIEVASYTSNEKYHIAKQHLIPKQIIKHGLTPEQLTISDTALREIIEGYTREAGVRLLERRVSELCRKAAKEVLVDKKPALNIKTTSLKKYLGIPRYRYEKMFDEPRVGVVRGLAWTEMGGDTLSVEVVKVIGKGNFKLTGRLGDVMKESASAAMSYLRSKTTEFGLEKDFYKKYDLHIHIPEGAVPKDGPSAGITMAMAMLSALTGKAVKNEVAMTGEITLRGRVLAIGGLKEKILAAKRAGITRIIVPKENEPHVEELEPEISKGVKIDYVEKMDEVVKIAFVDEK